MPTSTPVEDVLAAEEERCRATREGDLDALRAVLDESYTHVTGSGSTMNRDQYLAWVAETPRRHERRDLQVRVFGDAAVIVGPLTNHLSQADGSVRIIEAIVTQAAYRADGAWRFVAFQITPVR